MNESYRPTPSPPNLPEGLASLPVDLIPGLLSLLSDTSALLTHHYEQSEALAVEHKADRSPVTDADHNAHQCLVDGLASLTPHIPVLSEESAPEDIYSRRDWQVFWMVDPLDGTKEFLGRTGEFTVNVALIVNHEPSLGAIAQPMASQCYLGIPGQGLWRCHGAQFAQQLALQPDWGEGDRIRLLASKRHSEKRVASLVSRLAKSGKRVERVDAGSALKFCALVDGRADIYPRSSPCYEWDVAAGDALVRAVGGLVLNEDGVPMTYNARAELLVDYFVATAPAGRAWLPLLEGVHALFAASGKTVKEEVGGKSAHGGR